MNLIKTIIYSLAAIPSVLCAQSTVDVDEMHSDFTDLVTDSTSAICHPADYPAGYIEYDYVNELTAKTPYRRTRRGIFVVGSGSNVRAFETFGGTLASARSYADAVNSYHNAFPDINIWVMPIPTACAFYTPDAAADIPKSTHSFIRELLNSLNPAITGIDIYPALAEHVAEPIYSRTDHHWAPLGAYYAAEAFAAVAGLDFEPIEMFDTVVVKDYVGTMYRFSASPAVKNAPEDFVYYVPVNQPVDVTYTTYKLDKKRRNVISESEPHSGSFFVPMQGVATYSTFMGGDSKLTKIVTANKNGRRLAILKDSFGNALPPFLFSAFEEIHVIDCRYFTPNIKDYIAGNSITDILFANNVTHASTARTYDMYLKYLVQ
ncbi:MAG: hypothetical protein HFJ94_04910 [Muribaculaceae bacterium]|nr:hypothetical protein [Muribaculaceae bacterium]